MKSKNIKILCGLKTIRMITFVLVAVMILGNIPVSAASNKSITVKTQTALDKALSNSKVTTITIETSKKRTFVIDRAEGTEKKKLVISALKANVTNKLKFKSVTILKVGTYREEIDGNNILVKGSVASLTIGKGIEVGIITTEISKANIVVEDDGKIDSLVCKKKAANISLTVGANSVVSATLSKKTNFSVKGDTTAKVVITCKAKNSSVSTSVPVDISTTKKMTVSLEKGSEDTVIDKSMKTIKVKINDKSGKEPVIKVAGKVFEAEKTTPTPTPKVTPTPTETPTSTPKPSPVTSIIINDGPSSSSSSGSSSDDYSGGVADGNSSGGYAGGTTGGSSSGGYSSGTSTVDYSSGSSGGSSSGSYSGGSSDGTSAGSYSGDSSSGSSSGNYSDVSSSGPSAGNYSGNSSDSSSSGNYSGDASNENGSGDSSNGNNSGNSSDTSTDESGLINDSSNPDDNNGNPDNNSESQNIVSEEILKSYNKSSNNYTTWSSGIKSYLYKEDGDFWRVESAYVDGSREIHIERYNSNWEYVKSFNIDYDPELIWGGFYHGIKYNFIILGQINDEEDDNKMVIRVLKYDKQWNLIGTADLCGINTSGPFGAGSLSCTEKDGCLFILTCHEMYRSSDGKRHQSNISFMVEEETMTIPEGLGFIASYSSHSFNQFILANEFGQMVTMDHGDSHPRAIRLSIKNNGQNTEWFERSFYLVSFPGENGENTTGASVGGIEETSKGYVVAYNYDGFGGQNGLKTRSIYLQFVSKAESDINMPCSGTIIEYDPDGDVKPGTPIMVSMGLYKGGYVFWEEFETEGYYNNAKRVCFVKYDINGSISDVYSFDGKLSDCKPIYEDGCIHWYVTGEDTVNEYGWIESKSTEPCFYTLNTETGEIKKCSIGQSSIEVTISQYHKNATSFIQSGEEGSDILLTKDNYDVNGILTDTECYTNDGVLYAKTVYSYDENGFLAKKEYITDKSELQNIIYEYYSESSIVKTATSSFVYEGRTKTSVAMFSENGQKESEKTTLTSYDGEEVSLVTITEKTWLNDGKLYDLKTSDIYPDGRTVSDYTLYYENGNINQKVKEFTAVNELGEENVSRKHDYYSEDGKLVKYTQGDKTGIIYEVFYDDKGRTIRQVNRSGSEVIYDYSEDGSYVQTVKNGDVISNVSTYNADKKRIKYVEYSAETVTITYYDNSGRIISVEYTDGTEENLSSYTITYTYDEDSSFIFEKTWSDNRKIIESYDSNRNLLLREKYYSDGLKQYLLCNEKIGEKYKTIREENYNDDAENSLVNKFEYEYDETGLTMRYTNSQYNQYGISYFYERNYDDTSYDSDNNLIVTYSKAIYYYPSGKESSHNEYDEEYTDGYISKSVLKNGVEYYDDENHTVKSTCELVDVEGTKMAIAKFYSATGIMLYEIGDYNYERSYYNVNIVDTGYRDYYNADGTCSFRYIYELGVLTKRIDFQDGSPSKYYLYQDNQWVETEPFEY